MGVPSGNQRWRAGQFPFSSMCCFFPWAVPFSLGISQLDTFDYQRIFSIQYIIYEQSRKLKVHEKDINKFGQVPSLTLYKNDVWQNVGISRKTMYVQKVYDITFKGGIAIWEGAVYCLMFRWIRLSRLDPALIFQSGEPAMHGGLVICWHVHYPSLS